MKRYSGLPIAAALIIFFAWLAYEMRAGATLQFDEGIRDAIHQLANPALTVMMRGFSFVGEPAVLVPLGVLTVLYWTRAGRTRTALWFAIVVFGAEGLDQLLKSLFHRARPLAFFGYPQPAGYSFPSGHALVSCVFFGTMASLAAAHVQSKRARQMYFAGAALLIAAIGLSRIYLGVHYPSDVLAGYAAALVWMFALAPARRSS